MRPFACPNCQRLCHFEVRVCPECQATLGYDPAIDGFRFLADNASVWRDGDGAIDQVVVCANNNDYQICNWLVSSNDTTPLCVACRHNHVIPDLTVAGVPERWAKVEAAKRRLFHTLIQLGLPLETAEEKPGLQRLAFDFLYDPDAEQNRPAKVLTGHDEGRITLNLIEAHDAQREKLRMAMGEPYRTLLGHFRHEIGHHYWSVLVEPDEQALEEFRRVFGDERQDYEEALKAHYARTDQRDWCADHVSFYATSHPWEDFAETFAHYLHLVDLMATVRGFDLSLGAFPTQPSTRPIAVDFNPYTASAETLAGVAQPLSFALNALGRSLGHLDVYPFKLEPGVVAKLEFIRQLVAQARSAWRATTLESAG